VSGDVANTGNVGWTQYERANIVGDINKISNRTWARYINTDAVQIPAQYTFGNAGATGSGPTRSGIWMRPSSARFRSVRGFDWNSAPRLLTF